MNPSTVAARIDAVVEEFADLEGREKLELLLEYASRLPPLPPEVTAARPADQQRVHECQTPVFLWPEVRDGGAWLHADVAAEAPTVKGFVAILAEAVAGRPVEEVLAVGDDLVDRTGLAGVLGILRARGLRAIVGHAKRGLLLADGRGGAGAAP